MDDVLLVTLMRASSNIDDCKCDARTGFDLYKASRLSLKTEDASDFAGMCIRVDYSVPMFTVSHHLSRVSRRYQNFWSYRSYSAKLASVVGQLCSCLDKHLGPNQIYGCSDSPFTR